MNGRAENISFLISSGCTDHLINIKEYFDVFLMLKNSIKIAVSKINDIIIAVVGIVNSGNIELRGYLEEKKFS